jgi:hypothetical protein
MKPSFLSICSLQRCWPCWTHGTGKALCGWPKMYPTGGILFTRRTIMIPFLIHFNTMMMQGFQRIATLRCSWLVAFGQDLENLSLFRRSEKATIRA